MQSFNQSFNANPMIERVSDGHDRGRTGSDRRFGLPLMRMASMTSMMTMVSRMLMPLMMPMPLMMLMLVFACAMPGTAAAAAGGGAGRNSSAGDATGRDGTDRAALAAQSRELAAALERHRPQLYDDLVAAAAEPQRSFNRNPDLELAFIDDRGHPVFYGVHNAVAAATISTAPLWPGGGSGFGLSGAGTAPGRLAVSPAGVARAAVGLASGSIVVADLDKQVVERSIDLPAEPRDVVWLDLTAEGPMLPEWSDRSPGEIEIGRPRR